MSNNPAEKPSGEVLSTGDGNDPLSMVSRKSVFISYSHRDKKFLEELRRYLSPLRRSGKLEVWSDVDLLTGQNWRAEIGRAIDSARVAILLLSIDFMNSKFIQEVELPALLERAKIQVQ